MPMLLGTANYTQEMSTASASRPYSVARWLGFERCASDAQPANRTIAGSRLADPLGALESSGALHARIVVQRGR